MSRKKNCDIITPLADPLPSDFFHAKHRVRSLRRFAVLALAAASLITMLPCLLRAETLKDVLAKSESPLDAHSLPNLERSLTSSVVLDNEQWYVIAYYLQGNSFPSEEPLFVDRYDRKTHKWMSATISPAQRRAGEADCLGLGMSLDVSPDGFLLGTHLSPSAECLLVLSPDLAVRAALYGWRLASFRDGSIVFHRSQVHFAAAHPLEIGVYDGKTGRNYTIYPRKPFQAIRLAEIAKLRAFFKSNEEWCNIHNHPCDPEWFDNALDGSVAVDEQADALAFVVDYGSDTQDRDVPPVTVGHRKVVYVYRHVREESSIEYREMLQQDFAAGFGKISLAELLTPIRLKQIFGN